MTASRNCSGRVKSHTLQQQSIFTQIICNVKFSDFSCWSFITCSPRATLSTCFIFSEWFSPRPNNCLQIFADSALTFMENFGNFPILRADDRQDRSVQEKLITFLSEQRSRCVHVEIYRLLTHKQSHSLPLLLLLLLVVVNSYISSLACQSSRKASQKSLRYSLSHDSSSSSYIRRYMLARLRSLLSRATCKLFVQRKKVNMPRTDRTREPRTRM